MNIPSTQSVSEGHPLPLSSLKNPKSPQEINSKITGIFKECGEFHEFMHHEHLSFLCAKSTRTAQKKSFTRVINRDDSREYAAELERRAKNQFDSTSTPKDVLSGMKRLIIANHVHPYHLVASELFSKYKNQCEEMFTRKQPMNIEMLNGMHERIAEVKKKIITQSQSYGAYDPERKILLPVEVKEMKDPCPYPQKYSNGSLLDFDTMVAYTNLELDPLNEKERLLLKLDFEGLMSAASQRYSQCPMTDQSKKVDELYYDKGNRRYFFSFSSLCVLENKASRRLMFVYRTEIYEDFSHGEVAYFVPKIAKVFLDRLAVDEKALKRLEQHIQDYNDSLKSLADAPKVTTQPEDNTPATSMQTLLSAANPHKAAAKKGKGKRGKKKYSAKPAIVVSAKQKEAINLLVKPHEVFHLKKNDYETYLAILSKGKTTWDDAMSCLKSLQWVVKPAGGSIYKIRYQSSRHLLSPLTDNEAAEQAMDEKQQLSKNVHEPHGSFYREPLSDNRLKRIRDMLMEAGFHRENVQLKGD